MIDAVRAAFTALRDGERPPPSELNVLPIGLRGNVYVALDERQRPHVLLPTEDDAVPASDIAALELGSRTLVIGGAPARFLDIVCLFESLAEVFDYFVVAVTERLSEPATSPAQAVGEVLEQWRQFLIPGAGPPGRDRLAAVLGELIVVLDIVRAGGGGTIEAWVGPFGGRHDLRRGATAIEVKTTRSHTSRTVTIHGEDQLLEPDRGVLFLHLVRLEDVPSGGCSVGSVVDDILVAGAPARRLFEALTAGGVSVTDLPAAGNVRFEVRERMTFPVDGATPRIVPSSFAGGARPTGVTDVTYRIDLDHILDRAMDDGDYEAIVRQLCLERNTS